MRRKRITSGQPKRSFTGLTASEISRKRSVQSPRKRFIASIGLTPRPPVAARQPSQASGIRQSAKTTGFSP